MSAELNARSKVEQTARCLGLLLQFHGQAADPGRILAHVAFDEPNATASLARWLIRDGHKAKVVACTIDSLGSKPLPALAERAGGGYFVIARCADGKALVHDPSQGGPRAVDFAALGQMWTGRLLLFQPRDGGAGRVAGQFDLTWFLPAVVRYRRLLGEVLAASFFVQVMALVTPIFFQVVIDKVLTHRGLTSLDILVLGMGLVALFEVLLGGLRSYVLAHTASRMDVELGASLFHHMMALPMSFFGARPAGTVVARMRELETVRAFLTGSALGVAVDAVFAVVFFVAMYLYSPTLTWVVLATVPLYAALSLVVTPILRRRIDDRFKAAAENQAFLVECVSAAETVKAMAVEPQMQRRWERLLARQVGSSFAVSALANLGSQGVQAVSKATTVATLWWGARLVIDGELTIGELVAFNMLAARVSAPIVRLGQLWQDFQQVRVSVARMGDILDLPTERGAAVSALPAMRGRVSFESVTFRYAPDLPEALRRVSLDIPAGQVVGLVGASGSGKSTLAKLVQRLYVPESGRILVDGIDLAVADTVWLRRQIGVVLQENVLFSRTIRENIALSDPGMPMEAVIKAATVAGAHEFILELPETYDTIVGERGNTLSGGQRQRIALARALVGNPRLLILDEATSALDYESERLIRRNMKEICAGRTVLVVAHRLSAVRGCDRILVLERGAVIEDGSPQALLARGGAFARLWRAQQEDADA